jgi:hypothetical protein
MSSWISSLKSYHTENNLKYKIPKKGSEEYETILKYHNNIVGNKVVKEVKEVAPKEQLKPSKISKSVGAKTLKTIKTPKAPKAKKAPKVIAPDENIELNQDDDDEDGIV